MGTRSLTRFIERTNDGETEIACIYRQYDGYPEGLGMDLKSAAGHLALVNGYRDASRETNGMGCLAAIVVAKLKMANDPDNGRALCGNVYLCAPGTKDVGEEYVYTLREGEEIQSNPPRFGGNPRVIRLTVEDGGGNVLYDGPLSKFEPALCKEPDAA
jgi:hypothetical protein